MGSSIFPSQCGASATSFPIGIKYDWDNNVFRVVTLYNNTLCVATSSSSNPITATWTIIQYSNVTTYSFGFSYALWNGHQTVCWNQVCHILEPTTMTLAQFTNNVIGAPMYAINRGNFSDVTAPCGAFGVLNGSSIVLYLCQTVNFTSGNITFNVSSLSVPVVPAPGVAFSTYLRIAHGANGRLSYSYTSNMTTVNSGHLYIGEFPNQPAVFPLANGFSNTMDAIWTWNIVHDCRSTLYITANGVNINYSVGKRTFRLSTDPLNALVQTPQSVFGFKVNSFVGNVSAMPECAIDTNPLVSRTWLDSQFMLFTFPLIGNVVTRSVVLSEQHSVTYTAVDGCGTMMTCNQTQYLTTVAPC
jgi:hypothetical protein